jgi:hypothetical protein
MVPLRSRVSTAAICTQPLWFRVAKKPCEQLYAFRSAEEDRSGVYRSTTQRGHVRGAQGDEARPPGNPRRLCFFSPSQISYPIPRTVQGGEERRSVTSPPLRKLQHNCASPFPCGVTSLAVLRQSRFFIISFPEVAVSCSMPRQE